MRGQVFSPMRRREPLLSLCRSWGQLCAAASLIVAQPITRGGLNFSAIFGSNISRVEKITGRRGNVDSGEVSAGRV
jgi:hypothetical protein